MQIEHEEGIDFILEKLQAEPVARRIRILRWAANMCISRQASRELNEQAAELESAERRFQEFHFRFRQQMQRDGAGQKGGRS